MPAARSTWALEAMDRLRISSLAVAVWALLHGYFLLRIGFIPAQHPIGWGIFAVALTLAAALWHRRRWARFVVILLTAILLCGYATVWTRDSVTPCGLRELKCLVALGSQPVLTLIAFLILLSPWPLTFVGADRGE